MKAPISWQGRFLSVHPIVRFRARYGLWLLKTPNATKSLEFLDSPTQYRRHA
jgi:hypothetical protein